MICSVCLNPCIDRTVEIDAFAYGGLNRIRASRSDGCGKGVNVALVAREMGMEASVIGFLFEENGRCIAERLESAGAGEDCIWLPGAVRTNLKVFDRSTARITEINEPGGADPRGGAGAHGPKGPGVRRDLRHDGLHRVAAPGGAGGLLPDAD